MKNWVFALFFAVSSLSWASDLKGKGEIDVFGGGVHTDDSDHQIHGIVGFSGGYGVASMVQLFGEYSFVPLGDLGQPGLSAKAHLYTGGAKINLMKSDKFDPYGLIGFGGLHFTANCSSPGCSENDKTFHLGGGVRIYAKNKKWGVTPEIRWIHIFSDGSDTNVVSYTGGIFFQWGK